MYKVRFFFLPSGKSPIKEFIESSHESLRSKIVRQLRYLEEYGLTSSNPNLKRLTGTSLWEVRILGSDNVRIICVAIINCEVMILHIFKKKSNKAKSRDINLAIKRYRFLTNDI